MEDPRAIIARAPMHYSQILAICVATALNGLDGFDVLSISFAAPGIARDWGVGRADLGVVLSMELFGMGLGSLVLGSAADRFGRRPTVLGCLIVMAIGMSMASVAGGLVQLSAFRFFTGLGIGGMLAATNAIVAECSNAKRRNLAIAAMTAGYPLGAVIGGSVATKLLASTGHWQSVFQFGAISTACFIPVVIWLVPETVAFLFYKREPGALEQINRIMLRQGRPALSQLADPDSCKPRFSLPELFSADLRTVTPLLTVAYFMHMVTFYFFVKWIPKIVSDLGYTSATAGSVLVWANIGGACGAIAMSVLSQRFGIRSLVVFAMLLGAVAIGTFGHTSSNLQALWVLACIGGFFTNGATAGLYAVFARSFPANLRAGGTGFAIGVGRAGAAAGPIVAGLLFADGWRLVAVTMALASGTAIGAVALFFVRYRETSLA